MDLKLIELHKGKVVLALLLFLFTVYLIGSITREITVVTDNKETFIRNSKGNYWEVAESNLSIAIADLEDVGGGTVWIGNDLTLTAPIQLKDNIALDFEYHEVILDGDLSFVEVSDCEHAEVRNVHIELTVSGHESSVIRLYDLPGSSEGVRYNTFRNIVMTNPSSWTSGVGWSVREHDGIHLEVKEGSEITWNIFDNIQMYGPETGIHLECDHPTGFGDENYFKNVWIDQFETMIWFDVSPSSGKGFNRNVFEHVKGQSAEFSFDGVKSISNDENHFDHCLVWDWYIVENPNYVWSVDSTANNTFICAHANQDVHDEGSNTVLCGS
ncbi:hypothetical protein K8R43_04555 [archaeon]|nr:hypothetical protein [archaeon]